MYVFITVNRLTGNKIGPACVKDLSLALSECPQLHMLNLSCQCVECVCVMERVSLERIRSTEQLTVHGFRFKCMRACVHVCVCMWIDNC